MKISLVVAMSENRVIGRDNGLPWRLSGDLRYFKAVTMGKPIVMGRKTYESIGRPLPGRRNIVLTRDPAYRAPGCEVCPDLEQALALVGDVPEVMIIGGGALYAATLDRADRIYLTEVHATVEGDTWFPALDASRWKECSRERHEGDEGDGLAYSFVVLERRR